MDELNKISAKQLVEYIKQKKNSAVEVAQAYLAQIEKVNPTLNAIIQKANPEHILQQAKYADETLMKGKSIGKLHGLPITIKDTCNVKGFICAKGSKGYANHIPHHDATVVARLRKEGAIILGITNVPEFMFAFETENDLYGRTYNPYNLTRTPGGSSGGEAAIIAAGCSPFGLGSDGGGSIRLPAHNMQKFLADYDVIICPVAATPAKPHGVSHKEWRDFNYTMPYNLTGWPAATVRCGTTSDGLPIGVQVIAKPWHDYVALAVAKKLEQLFGGWQEPILC